MPAKARRCMGFILNKRSAPPARRSARSRVLDEHGVIDVHDVASRRIHPDANHRPGRWRWYPARTESDGVPLVAADKDASAGDRLPVDVDANESSRMGGAGVDREQHVAGL